MKVSRSVALRNELSRGGRYSKNYRVVTGSRFHSEDTIATNIIKEALIDQMNAGVVKKIDVNTIDNSYQLSGEELDRFKLFQDVKKYRRESKFLDSIYRRFKKVKLSPKQIEVIKSIIEKCKTVERSLIGVDPKLNELDKTQLYSYSMIEKYKDRHVILNSMYQNSKRRKLTDSQIRYCNNIVTSLIRSDEIYETQRKLL